MTGLPFRAPSTDGRPPIYSADGVRRRPVPGRLCASGEATGLAEYSRQPVGGKAVLDSALPQHTSATLPLRKCRGNCRADTVPTLRLT